MPPDFYRIILTQFSPWQKTPLNVGAFANLLKLLGIVFSLKRWIFLTQGNKIQASVSLNKGEKNMANKDRIVSLEARHHELEEAIHAENARPHPDEDQIHTLKKEKLKIKDEINSLSGV